MKLLKLLKWEVPRTLGRIWVAYACVLVAVAGLLLARVGPPGLAGGLLVPCMALGALALVVCFVYVVVEPALALHRPTARLVKTADRNAFFLFVARWAGLLAATVLNLVLCLLFAAQLAAVAGRVLGPDSLTPLFAYANEVAFTAEDALSAPLWGAVVGLAAVVAGSLPFTRPLRVPATLVLGLAGLLVLEGLLAVLGNDLFDRFSEASATVIIILVYLAVTGLVLWLTAHLYQSKYDAAFP